MEGEGTKKVQTAASCPLSVQVFRSTAAHVHKVEDHKLEKLKSVWSWNVMKLKFAWLANTTPKEQIAPHILSLIPWKFGISTIPVRFVQI